MQFWQNFGYKLDYNYWQGSKVFWQTIQTSPQMKIAYCYIHQRLIKCVTQQRGWPPWQMKWVFITITPSDTQEVHLERIMSPRQRQVFVDVQVRNAGKVDIRPEMINAIGVSPSRVCQVASEYWQIEVVISKNKKVGRRECSSYRSISLYPPGKKMPRYNLTKAGACPVQLFSQP